MNWPPIIIVCVQVTLVALLGLLAAARLRSAAHRHSVLFATLLCILASPLFYAGAAWSGLSIDVSAVLPKTKAPAESHSISEVQQRPHLPVDQAPFAPPLELPVDSSQALPVVPAEPLAERAANVNAVPARPPFLIFRTDLLIGGVWLAGTLLSLFGVFRSQLKTESILREAHPVAPALDRDIIAEAERQLGCPLRIATTGKVPGPAVVGIFRPSILIPARYLETLTPEELLQILIHEGAHALRRDPLVALLQRIAAALFWWHPFVHLVNRELARAREEVCDNFVLTHTEPENYGATLLRLATLSPAMARLPLAIGMFDERGKLEERIRGLLDSRRNILTHVRFATAATVLSVFAILSMVVAAARVGAESPADAPPGAPAVAKKEAGETPEEAVDAKDFSLILTYHGEFDKPFYGLTLKVPSRGAQQAYPFFLAQQIDEGQAQKLIKHLKESQFFEHAKKTKTQDDPTTGPQYLLRVQLGGSHFEETLGWDVGTLTRLDAIRKSLDGDAAKLMDQLLARLEGQRKVWESGEVVNDLKTALKAESTSAATDSANDDDYRMLHDRYRALILAAARAGKKDDVAKLTDKFNESIGGKLLFAQVTPRSGPIAEHEAMFSKFFDPQRKIGIGKLGFAASDKPIVSQNHDGQGVVLVATNPLGGNKWPENLQVTLLMDNVAKKDIGKPPAEPKWGEVIDGFRARLSAGKQKFDAGEPIPVRLEIENSGEVDKEYLVSVIPANQTVRVVDDQGRDVQPLLNLYQVTVGASRPESIKAGRSIEIASFDLAEAFYLRRPGRYKVSWSGKPASAEFEFEVTPNAVRASADGDPVGRLLPLVKESWWLGAGPKGKFKPGSNWGEARGQIIRFVRNPPAHNGDGFINLCLMDELAAAIPENSNSSIPTSEYLGRIGRWHVYYLASEIGLKTWPTAKDDIKQALAGVAKVSIQIDAERAEFVAGESVSVPITICNVGKQEIRAPETFWSARVILDGKEYQRLAQTPWSGAGFIPPSASLKESIRLSNHEFGIKPSALAVGKHKLALKLSNETSNEVLLTILAERRKVSLKIDADRLTFGPAEDVTVMATIGNLDTTNLEAPPTYWAARVILDGKEYTRQPKFIGNWNGPGFIIPGGMYRGGITLREYGIDPETLTPGKHKLSLQFGDEKSNELTFHIQDPAQAAALLKTHLAEIAAIKPGGTREELLKAFQAEGGLSTRARQRYAYRANPNIKVDVTFAAVGMLEEKLKESPRDKVLAISEPILESPISDALTVAAPKRDPKFSITLAAPARVVPPSGNIELTITLKNLQKEKIPMSWVNGNTRVIFDGKDIGAMGFSVDRGPAGLDSQQAFRTTQTLRLGGQRPGAHTFALQIGDDVSNKLEVDLGWSETVEGLKARLSVETKKVVEGATLLGVHLELQNASETRETKELHLKIENIKFAVVDGEGRAVSGPDVIDYGGRAPGPWTVRLAPGGSQRVDISSWGLSIRPNLAAVLDLGPTYAWEFKRGDPGPYYLQAGLEVAKDPAKASAWSGTIQLPKVRIPLTAEDRVGRIDEAIGFIKKRYQVPVRRIDDHTLGVIWESGAREAFEELKKHVKTEFGIDVKISATE